MFRPLALLLGLCSLLLPMLSAGSSGSVPDFALIDQFGRFHQLSRYVDARAVVILVYDKDSEPSKAALPELISLSRRYQGAPVQFMALVADSAESRNSLSELAQSLGTDLPFLLDDSQLVSDALVIRESAEVLIIDPVRLQMLYRGGIGLYNNAPMQQALAANLPGMTSHLHYLVHSVLRGEPILTDVMPVSGRPLVLDKLEAVRSQPVSYEADIAPILMDRCVECHKTGGIAPWAMDSHRMVQGWSSMIRETLLTRRMPPGQIDPQYADRYDDVHHISDHEMALLMNWIELGAPRSSGHEDPLAQQKPEHSSWQLGEPDLVIEFPPQNIPATGVLEYVFVPIELGLTEGKWVTAYEFDIGDKSALHHIIIYTQDARQRRQNASGGGSRTNFGGYAPGREYVVLSEGTGIELKRDMRFMIQFHYTAIGRELVDRSRLGLHFSDTPPARALSRTAVMNGDFVIPPGTREFPVSATTVIPHDSYLYSFAPHMHFRGKRIRFSAHYPDGSRESLLSIPNFQHNWQMVYRLKEPVFLPAGTEIVAEGAFDNSRYNPLNPDPGQSVVWGDQVWDEMFITWMRIADAN
ncbi:MAG: redoxin domain-containing protein [Pseudohongiella sp.]|nr:redoxin domain-containing protein [Pseudohongiella sp.]MDO9522076.1 redoxin domain-containing protein [Pseudohongiella sp.]MDP2129134.1 redoxin domain-containing protein [Pseudohongiella sp.]